MSETKTTRSLDDVMRDIVQKLRSDEFIYDDTYFDHNDFLDFKSRLVGKISLPSTTISPIMERFLFACASSSKAQKIVVLGSYYGYALLWLAGSTRTQATSQVIGIDTNQEACIGAVHNVNQAGLHHVHIVCEDAFTATDQFENEEIDVLFLDVEKDGSKAAYTPLLQTWFPKLRSNALILAHDPLVQKFSSDFYEYHQMVQDETRFCKTVTLPLDKCGIEVSRKR